MPTAKLICGQMAPVYGFYLFPELKMVKSASGDREMVVFTCSVPTCQHKVNVYMGTKDFGSTRNLRRHARCCRGVVKAMGLPPGLEGQPVPNLAKPVTQHR